MLLKARRHELVLITGVHGFLGQHTVRLFLDESNYELVLTGREQTTLFADIKEEPRVHAYYPMDITDRASVREVVQSVKPDVIVNCAAYVKVDNAERDRETTWKTNVSAVEHLAESARKVDARIVQISSDYVFDGTRAPYSESDAAHPLNYYGRTKLASENVLRTSGIEHTIIRTCLLYGAAEHANVNFALAVVEALQAEKPIELPTDLYSSPTLVDDVALAIVRATERHKTGLYHIGGPEMLSRFQFAGRIAKAFRLNASLITPVLSEDMPKPEVRAERPMRSGFVCLKAQTDLSLRISNVDEGLQVMSRGMHDLENPVEQYIYE
jgi:dTDP-4-dehydrorhamnose reductase